MGTGGGGEPSKTSRGLIFRQKEHPCFDASELQLWLKLFLSLSLFICIVSIRFVCPVDFLRGKDRDRRDRVDENSGVNRVVAPNRNIRDKEKTSEFILSHMYLFISVTLDRKRKKIKKET